MATVESYERPRTIEAALAALARPGAIPLGGGTLLNARPTREAVAIVDLQALGLDRIEPLAEGRLRIGAGVTLQALVDHPAVPATVREAARRGSRAPSAPPQPSAAASRPVSPTASSSPRCSCTTSPSTPRRAPL